MSKLGADPFPNYRSVNPYIIQAGFHIDTKDQSTAICLQPPQRNLKTPQDIKHYRKSYKQQHGVTIQHYGVVKDPLPNQHHTYGVPTLKSQYAGSIMKASDKRGINNFVNEVYESKYKSHKMQPLAKTITRNYNMPPQTKNQEFKYGVPTQKNKYDVKETIYSGENMPQPEQIRQMYLKSHKDYDPGQQKKRPYNWTVDPSDFRFGQVAKNVIYGQMKQVMAPQNNTQSFPQTKMINTHQLDFINRKQDKLGKPANLGQKRFPPDHAFGVRIQPNQWGAGKCIKGQANHFQVRPDDDLGRSTKTGLRNIPHQGDQDRKFGVPTIRYDIKKPAQQSVADPNNYADETTAIELIFPQMQKSMGVQDQDFNMPMSRQQIRQIFENIGFEFRGNIFDAIFERGKGIHGTILDKISVNSFRKAIYDIYGR